MSLNVKSEQTWIRLIKIFAGSGMNKAEFCRQNKLAVTQFYYWCTKLRPDLNISPETTLASKNLFLPVKVPKKENNIRIKLQNGVELEFPSMPDTAWMAKLINELGNYHDNA